MSIFYQNRPEQFHSFVSKDNTFPPHLHRQTEIIYVLSGSIEISIGQKPYQLKKGDIAVTFPNRIHSCNTLNSSRIFLLIFEPRFVHEFSLEFSEYQTDCPVVRSSCLSDYGREALKALVALSGSACDMRLRKGFLSVFLSEVFSCLTLSKVSSEVGSDISQRLLLYLDQHFTENLSLPILSKELGVSKFYLSHVFSDKLHTSFSGYLNGKRLELAKNLLISTDMPVSDIALDSGFSSSRTFFRSFRRAYGMSPGQYRSGSGSTSAK